MLVYFFHQNGSQFKSHESSDVFSFCQTIRVFLVFFFTTSHHQKTPPFVSPSVVVFSPDLHPVSPWLRHAEPGIRWRLRLGLGLRLRMDRQQPLPGEVAPFLESDGGGPEGPRGPPKSCKIGAVEYSKLWFWDVLGKPFFMYTF